MWNAEQIPQQLKDANLVHIYKRKGNKQVCDNHCGISLLSIAEKILAHVYIYMSGWQRQKCVCICACVCVCVCVCLSVCLSVLLNHLLLDLEQGLLPDSQCGFRVERGTVDMVFAAR